jgi:endonuclease IV
MVTGFSTGSIAPGDAMRGAFVMQQKEIHYIEISALREHEFEALLPQLNLFSSMNFTYISFHAPSRIQQMDEDKLVQLLGLVAEREWPVIVHPDIITDYQLWRKLGRFLCIENMDARKPIGRTAAEMQLIFSYLPEAQFCIDAAHARQVDASMNEALVMLHQFGHKLCQVHISDLNQQSRHIPLNKEAVTAYRKILPFIDNQIPFIIESPLALDAMEQEVKWVELIAADAPGVGITAA